LQQGGIGVAIGETPPSLGTASNIAHEREAIAAKRRILAGMMSFDRKSSAATQVVIAASQVGRTRTSIVKLWE